MLVYSAILPPSPLLLPSIGKEHTPKLAATTDALKKINNGLHASHADACVVISQYASLKKRFGIGIQDAYTGTLKSFGDLTELHVRGFPALGHALLTHLPSSLASAASLETLDHGTIAALRLLSLKPQPPLIPLHPCALSYESHVRLGAALKDPILSSASRIALLAIGDLSHHVSEASPEGMRPEGVLFDKQMLAALSKCSSKQLLQIADTYKDESPTSGLKAFLILTGILQHLRTEFTLLSYEAPFGIGYMTAEYII